MSAPQRPGTPGPRDPAAQPERTALAWRRTALAFAVVTLFAWRVPAATGSPGGWTLAAAAACGTAGVAFLVVAARRGVWLRAARPAALSPPVAVMAAGTVVLAAAGGVALVLSR
ncbi:DUF202 domain-containing protein [Streptomyces lonarensis]|uniref:DUF202 domain-containing protein n=1 Tax=Streptomyces lonarensis TaxID=700599 RepID=A0A7X6D3Z3_9ACTN|nr:DUF202 domain-containing protein [Streptomyces lonarensis]NJQ07762.1 DUF202 domain-containing protein [Streptomyces lonarensis]